VGTFLNMILFTIPGPSVSAAWWQLFDDAITRAAN
jgi:hypothetical protein